MNTDPAPAARLAEELGVDASTPTSSASTRMAPHTQLVIVVAHPATPTERTLDGVIGPPAGRGAIAASAMIWVGNYNLRCASCVRDLTSSLRNALCRWYSTVLGLMKS